MDNYKLGLVVEGGGMRGIICTAALLALNKLGFGNCFDGLYGTSAGAIGGAYFLSGKPEVGTAIFYDNLVGNNFINLLRFKNILDINYLFDNYVDRARPIDKVKILHHQTDFFISTTNVNSGKNCWFDNRNMNTELLIKALRASASTPLYSSHKEIINNELYNDGMIDSGVPIRKAIEEGCTHVVALLTRAHGYRKKSTPVIKSIESIILSLRNYSQQYKEAFFSRVKTYNDDLDSLYSLEKDRTLIIAPEKTDFVISNSETNEEKLRISALESIQRVYRTFDEQSTMTNSNILL